MTNNTFRTTIIALSAQNIHKPLAPWYLKAFCESNTENNVIDILECSINDNLSMIVGEIYKKSPDVAAFSCYIWNIEQVNKITSMLRKILPSCIVVLGGPEVSFENDLTNYSSADYIIRGAGEVAFCNLLQTLALGKKPELAIIESGVQLCDIPKPYTNEYFNSFSTSVMQDMQNQLVYYESTRGCPFSCSYCLSSTSKIMQALPVDRVMEELTQIISQGARCIKFVDRTFNADKRRALDILRFIASLDTSCTFHFEAAADLFDDELIAVIAGMPQTRVQFEIGVQSTNPASLKAVHRLTDTAKVLANIKRLTDLGNCHIHVDLIAGLPYETLDTFIDGFNRTIQTRPHMLQLGFLKLLKGSELRRDSALYGYEYSSHPPYEILKSGTMSFADIILLKEIEEIFDRFYNSGFFHNTLCYAMSTVFSSSFDFFKELTAFCKNNGGIKVPLKNTYGLLKNFLLLYGEKDEVLHFVKLDCVAFNTKGVIPDDIPTHRDRHSELMIKQSTGYKNVRVEYFSYDDKKRGFVYDVKNPVTKEYLMIEI